MIIANPIYDIVFKRLMENKRIAVFFIGTLIGEKIEDIAMMPKEYTYEKKSKKQEEKKEGKDRKKEKKEVEILSVIHYDFVATICNSAGENKKILIEIQKSSKPTDLMRFRTYLGEQYKLQDVVEVATGKVEKALPIITIYPLGFTIPKIETPAVKVNRTYIDMISKNEIKEKSKLIESLTHDGYFVQIPRINGKPRTLLEKLLSVFEQRYFIDDKETIKEYGYPSDNNELEEILEILKYFASDPRAKREMEASWWADQDEKEYERLRQEIAENKKTIEEKEKSLAEKEKSLDEKDKSLAEKDREIAELKRLLGKFNDKSDNNNNKQPY
jgi:hypothetical protein